MRTAVLALALVGVVAGSAAAQPSQTPRDPAARAERATRHRSMGIALLSAGDPGSALAYFRDAIAADRTDAESYRLLAGIYLDRGSVADALAVLEAGLRERPEHGPLWQTLARAHELAGDLGQAAAAMRELVARVPADPESHFARAELARRRHAWSEALASYRAVLDLAASGAAFPEPRVREARDYAEALTLLVRETDPVRGRDRCASASVVRRALARCD